MTCKSWMPDATGELSMVVLLPKQIDGLPQLERTLTPERLQEWTKGLERQKVIVYVPRFKMTSQFSLKETLQAMGMVLAFDARADFSRMSRNARLSISAVVHKAFVDVNEEGTEAAAATAVVVVGGSLRTKGTAYLPCGPSLPVPDPGKPDRQHPVHGSVANPTDSRRAGS